MRNISPIIFIIISIGIFFMFVNPIYMDTKQIKSDVAIYDTALTNATNLQATRDTLVKNYESITNDEKDRLDHFLPNSVDNIQLILQIQKIATAHNLALKNIKFDAPTPDKTDTSTAAAAPKTVSVSGGKTASAPYGTFNLEFSTDAKYEDFISFLKDVEYNIRLINVKNISFSVPTQTVAKQFDPNNPDVSNDPNVYTYSLKIETYWLK